MRKVPVFHGRYADRGDRPGLLVEVPCHCCWQCRADKVRNWTGKALAEAKTSAAVDFVTLTYCSESSPHIKWIKDPVPEPFTKSLNYRDVQLWLKRIRKAGHKVRYIVAGEYGEQKGRAHWHVLLFWQDKRPDRFGWKKEKGLWGKALLYGNEWQDEFWHHGHVNYQPFSEQAAKYVCKYLLKWDKVPGRPDEPTRQTKFRYSSRPGIGFNWICDHWAQLHVDRGLAPQSPKYSFPDVLRNGVRVDFKMTPHCAVKFVQEFERRYYEQKGDHPPSSEFCEKMLSKVARRLVTDGLEQPRFCPRPDLTDDFGPWQGEPVLLDQKRNAYYYETQARSPVRYWWSYDERGHRAWRKNLVSDRVARSLRAVADSGHLQSMSSSLRQSRPFLGAQTSG